MQSYHSLNLSSGHLIKTLIIFTIIALSVVLNPTESVSAQPYLDPTLSLDERVEDLMARMNLKEKVGQMTQLDITMINHERQQSDVSLDPEKARTLLKEHHIGSFLNGEAVPAQQWIDYITRLQKIAVEETRLGIPIIYGIDHMHGASYLAGSTIFPHNINIGATFNTENALQNGRITALEAGPLGHVWNFAPVLDLGKNPYWPRVYETYGEDPYLASRLGKAYVSGLQAKYDEFPYRIAATGKHFLGYSVPRSGWDRTPVDLSMQTIHEFHRPSFQAAIDAGMKTMMLNSGEVNGIPVHASKGLLTGLLREKMGFEGVIVTDWADIGKLYDYHHTARSYEEATFQAIDAGVDMSMTPRSLKFNESLINLVQKGKISEKRLNESVRRILRLKFELGLFEHPYPTGKGIQNIGSPSHKAVALRAARESLVLLQNQDRTLPLSNEVQNLLVVGPSANSKRNLSGGWTLAWQGGNEDQYPEDVKTISEALQIEFPSAKITALNSIGKPDTNLRSEFESAAVEADAIIIAAGEEPYTEFVGNITDLSLADDQLELIKTVNRTGKPSVLVLVEGRPRVISDIVDDTDAIIWAGLPGFEGAEAIANLISGRINPIGKLPFSYPQYVGYFVPYNHKPSASYHFDSEVANNIEQDDETIAEWEFGHGLSYTSFSYQDFNIDKTSIVEHGSIEAEVTITNTGDRTGTEVVLWFISDEVGKISRPVKELVQFERVTLKPGESKRVSLNIEPKIDLTYPDFEGKPVLEEGYFKVRVGEDFKRFYLELTKPE